MRNLLGETVITHDLKIIGIVIKMQGPNKDFCLVRYFDSEKNRYFKKRVYAPFVHICPPQEELFQFEMRDPEFWEWLHECETEVALISNDRAWFESIQEEKKLQKPETID